METIEQETLLEQRKRLSREEDCLKVEMGDIELEAKSVGSRLESLTMLAMKMETQATLLQERHDEIKSRLMEISDELDLIAEAGN